MTAEETVATNYVKVSSASDVLRVDTTSIYRLLARGALSGLVIDGIRFVEIASLERYIASRAKLTA